MRFRANIMLALSSALLLGSCSTLPEQGARSPDDEQELTKALAGHVAGPPVNCISNFRSTDMKIIDDWTILFEVGSTIYLQSPRGGCPGIESNRNTMVSILRGTTQLCSGDINHLVDMHTGMGGGACVFGPFVPYRKVSS